MFIIGLMSGTSLDGLDIAYCRFDDERHYTLIAAETYPYPEEFQKKLASLHLASAMEYAHVDAELGHYFGMMVQRFRNDHPGRVDCIASHGHTVFHQPLKNSHTLSAISNNVGFTSQIGDGNAIAAETNLPVVYDFRRLDVALGGQGAPLVPIGDQLLFGQYEFCVNLGGIANISFENNGQRIAYDICPCNMILNYLASKIGLGYDANGAMAKSGNIVTGLLEKIESFDFYSLPIPKTLGREWFENSLLPCFTEFDNRPVNDLLRTATEHIALRIANAIRTALPSPAKALFSGGGAKNSFLMERVAQLTQGYEITVAEHIITDYKEAIIFALLAYLRMNNMVNTLASVTGASRDSCGGTVVLP